MKTYFMGSGSIGIPCLEVLASSDSVELAGIGTQLDKPCGRNRRLAPTPVGKWAEERGVAADKIKSANAPEFFDRLKSMAPDIVIVVSFGQILRESVLELPRLGCLNVHASLLPKYRGASPIVSAILNGDPRTGVSFMRMDKGLDTGGVYLSAELEIGPDATAGSLEEELGALAARRLEEVLAGVADGSLKPVPQDAARATHCSKIHRGDGLINWADDAASLCRRVRAYNPWPGVTFLLGLPGRETEIRIGSARPAENGPGGEPGEVLQADKNRWVVACGGGAVELLSVTPQGKNEMRGVDFLRGRPVPKGFVLTAPQPKK